MATVLRGEHLVERAVDARLQRRRRLLLPDEPVMRLARGAPDVLAAERRRRHAALEAEQDGLVLEVPVMFVMSVLKSMGVSVMRTPILARSSRMKFAMLTRSALLLLVFSMKFTWLPRASSRNPSPLVSLNPIPASSFFASAGL